ncbi:lipoprotein N-acyltransferase Lnb domain-containing protein [Paraliomyxa miuraensis]|uniref:lipoprotein N-acyltransferase Lnb domain-containing protein n=1 Tax=Paraliomyxa miuraensis TaxID=376150 RepID=UPI002258DD05|nr:DUF4105 domain-containing protein [Paraliomyxa miuraensis]MCX4246818.1 DUF4105 domain-containing protein [Paraliomyxa miuraensis]
MHRRLRLELGLRRIRIALLAVLLHVLHTAIAHAAPDPHEAQAARYRVDLLTMGPGDALPTRGGHAALAACELLADGRELCIVYNYGDANFDESWLEFRFVFGHVKGFLSIVGNVYDAAELYGQLQNRDVWRQRLALDDAQARLVAERLAWQALPGNREYAFHHLDATCTTGIRELLDEVLDGQLAAQLGGHPEPWTIRDYQQLVFDELVIIGPLADAAFGRRHDGPIDQYFALLWPWKMREYLQDVRVPDPAGGDALVPLAGPPELLAERQGPPAIADRNRYSWWISGLGAGLVLVGAVLLRRRNAVPSRVAGWWLLAWSLPIGSLGLVLTILSVGSSVPELRDNELVLSTVATDLLLSRPAIAWVRGRTTVPRWLRTYAKVRLGVVGLAVGARGVGLFVQQPWVLPVASLVCGLSLWWALRPARA